MRTITELLRQSWDAHQNNAGDEAFELLHEAVREIEARLPKPITLKTIDPKRMLFVAKGCHDYGGGYRDPKQAEIYHHGIQTVVNALTAFLADQNDTQVNALERIGTQETT